MKKAIRLAAMALLLSSCNYTSGTNVTTDQVKEFNVGHTTIAELEAKLGKPTNVKQNSDGTQTLDYEYSNTHQDAVNYVPVVGLFTNQVEETENTTSFVFDSSGILKSYSTGTRNATINGH